VHPRPSRLSPRKSSPGASSTRLHLSGLPPCAPPWGCVATHCASCSCAASLARLSSSLVLARGHYIWKRLSQTKDCSSEQERKKQLELLLLTEYGERRGKEMSKRCLGCRITWL
jgi:hypothetical protein